MAKSTETNDSKYMKVSTVHVMNGKSRPFVRQKARLDFTIHIGSIPALLISIKKYPDLQHPTFIKSPTVYLKNKKEICRV